MNESIHMNEAEAQDDAARFGGSLRGCFFCKSGKEAEAVRQFEISFPEGRAIFPTRTRFRRTREAAIEERAPLLPGYMFFETAVEVGRSDGFQEALRAFARNGSVLKLLRYTDGQWALHGADDQFARVLFESAGNIGVSRAYFDEGHRIRILDGFLKDHEGSIVRVNRKNRTVEVSVDFQGKRVSMWLGYELVTGIDSAGREMA